MKIKKAINFCLVAAVLMTYLCLLPLPARAFTHSGTCGDNLTWIVDTDTGVLTISGTGPMGDFGYSDVPWGAYRNSIQNVVIEAGVTSIGESAFDGCTSLTGITIPDSVTSIGRSAFDGCTSLTGITIPDSVTSIGGSAFYDCSSLTSITIPDGVTSIDYEVFSGCSSLASVTLPDSVTSIGGYAFDGCTSLTNITIPDSVTNVGSGFDSCESLEFNEYDGVKYLGNDANPYLVLVGVMDAKITICNIHEDTRVIAGSAFIDCIRLIIITIPDSVTSIGPGAFYGCVRLTDVTIPDSVTSIGAAAFYHCSSLASVTISDSVTSIEDRVFEDCDSLTSVTLPNSVTSICDYAFAFCNMLTDITIPDSVTSIGSSAFFECNNLTSITIPESVINIVYAFGGCRSLEFNEYDGGKYLGNSTNPYLVFVGTVDRGITTCNIHEDTRVIAGGAFDRYESMTSIAIPDGVTSISDRAFFGSGLTSITIPDSVINIGNSAFDSCFNLWHVFYKGSETQWNSISVGIDNEKLTSATRHYNSTGDELCVEIVKDRTCTTDGTCRHTCSACEVAVARKIYAQGHIWKWATCTDPKTCTTCGETEGEPLKGAGEHAWDEGQVTKEPTCAEDGEKTYLCGICRDTKTEPIEKTGEHTYDHDKDDTCNVCGHEREVDSGSGDRLIWTIVIIVVGLGCVTAVVLVLRKKK